MAPGDLASLMPGVGSAIALVLRRSDSGESDRRIVVLTEELGKIELYAKGARKGGSRLASSTEPLVVARYSWASGRARCFINSVEPRSSFPGLRLDYDRLSAALAWAELLDAALSSEIPSSEVFVLALQVLTAIEIHPSPVIPLLWGMSVLLSYEGHQPEWTVCVESGEPVQVNPAYVSPHAGGHVNNISAGGYSDRFQVTGEALVALSRLPDLAQPPGAIKHYQDVLLALMSFWQSITDRRLPAIDAVYKSLDLNLG